MLNKIFAACVLGGLVAGPSYAAELPFAVPIEKRVEALEDTVTTLKRQVADLRATCTCAAAPPAAGKFGAASPKMIKAGLNWTDVTNFANHIVNVLEKDGSAALSVARNGLKLIEAVTERDLTGILTTISSGRADIAQIVNDIRVEFGLTPAPAARLPVASFTPAAPPVYSYGAPTVTYGTPTGTYGTPTYSYGTDVFGADPFGGASAGGCVGGSCAVPGTVGRSGPLRRIFGR